MKNLSVEKVVNGWRVSTVVGERLVSRLYIGYTKRQAISSFKGFCMAL